MNQQQLANRLFYMFLQKSIIKEMNSVIATTSTYVVSVRCPLNFDFICNVES